MPMPESAIFATPAPGLLCFRESESVVRLVGPTAAAEFDCRIAAGDATAVHTLLESPGRALVAIGERNGVVRVVSVDTAQPAAIDCLFEERVHDGPALGVMLADTQTIVSGGSDKKIALIPFRGTATSRRNLQVNLRCRGLKTAGLKPAAQKLALDQLIARVSA